MHNSCCVFFLSAVRADLSTRTSERKIENLFSIFVERRVGKILLPAQ